MTSTSIPASILIVEDNAVNMEILRLHLLTAGYTVACAENGLEALARMKTEQFDLALLDIMMPEMDGIELLEAMKSSPKLCDIPVMMVSAVNDWQHVTNSIYLGAEDYISKPFDGKLLMSRVWRILNKHIKNTISRTSRNDGGRTFTVMAVDDSPVDLEVLESQLAQCGHTVIRATSGQQALGLLKHQKPDVILLDVGMPDMDGYEVLQALKTNAELAPIPVLMLSANEEPAMVSECIRLGAEDYILKPFNLVLLRSRIEDLLIDS